MVQCNTEEREMALNRPLVSREEAAIRWRLALGHYLRTKRLELRAALKLALA
jgi:hypothetical protein